MEDLISRQAAIDVLTESLNKIPMINNTTNEMIRRDERITCIHEIIRLPSAEPEIIRCKDCDWWDKIGDSDNGYCMAAKHGYWSEHWEISIRRTYKEDFYCADAEMKGEQDANND